MSIHRHAHAHWSGNGKEGKGALTSQSGVLRETPYGFNTRFGDAPGTNPEELIAAAHAGCFTMALAFKLQAAGHVAEALDTKATLTMEQEGAGFRISAIVLTLSARVPGLGAEDFQRLAADAKATCPVSRVVNAEITLEASLAE